MGKKKYIDFEEFVNNSGVKASTIERNYKKIPGLTKTKDGFKVLSGTRYLYNVRNTTINDSASKRYTLLKAISTYRYISNKELRIEQPQFEAMLKDLLSAGLIQRNGLSNTYGANAYDCTTLGDEVIKKSKKQLVETIVSAAGIFTGKVVSQIFDAA